MKINKNSKDALGDWCKFLERNFSPEQMIPKLPVIIRLDGNNFSQWTRGLEKPFDMRFVQLMQDTCEYLHKETNAILSYVQSDEITLILYSDNRKSSIYHDGKKQKILSKLTGKCVNFFNERRKSLLPQHNKTANFDCRIYQAPTLDDACLQVLWRENDATRNSILGLSYSHYSQEQVNGLNTSILQDKLMTEKGVNWNNLPVVLKRGTYFRRTVVEKPFTADELAGLPPLHKARTNPDLVLKRNVINQVEFPIMNTISNRVGVIFFGEEPKQYEKQIN